MARKASPHRSNQLRKPQHEKDKLKEAVREEKEEEVDEDCIFKFMDHYI